MKSKTSFFNRGIARNFLQRFWPLWTVYLAVLLLVLPGALSNDLEMIRRGFTISMDLNAVRIGIGLVLFSALVGIVTAMAMFHYLYQTRSCGMMNTLPLRRETMFCTVYLTGLVPLLLIDLFVMLLTALLYCPGGYLRFVTLLDWLGLVVMGNAAFYGFAVFCAVLTGNLLVLPAVYTVLSFTAVVAEGSARYLLSTFVFGLRSGGLTLDWLSPVVGLMEGLSTDYVYEGSGLNMVMRTDIYVLTGRGLLGAYCAAGLLLSLAALLLYRRRQMETATDVVAIPVLKPVFKYCLSFGTALVFAWLIDNFFLKLSPGGAANPWIVLGLMLLGAFIGYFAAEMMIQKTLKVFGGKWRGFAAACAVIVLFVCAFEFDVFGYERRVPAAEQVEAVGINSVGSVADLTKPEDIAAALDFHRAVIADKDRCDRDGSYYITVSYRLKNGRMMDRSYRLPAEGAAAPDSLPRQAEALLNKQDALTARMIQPIPVDKQTVINAAVEYGDWFEEAPTGEKSFGFNSLALTGEQAISLYEEGILPDLADGHIGRVHLVNDEEIYQTVYPVKVNIDLRDLEGDGYRAFYFINTDVEADSVNTLRWISENLGLELKTYAELGIGSETMVLYGAG